MSDSPRQEAAKVDEGNGKEVGGGGQAEPVTNLVMDGEGKEKGEQQPPLAADQLQVEEEAVGKEAEGTQGKDCKEGEGHNNSKPGARRKRKNAGPKRVESGQSSVASLKNTPADQQQQKSVFLKRPAYASPTNVEGQPVLHIHRRYKNADGTEYEQDEMVEDPRLIEVYLKMRTLVGQQKLRDFAFDDPGAVQDFRQFRRKMQKRLAYHSKKKAQTERNKQRIVAYHARQNGGTGGEGKKQEEIGNAEPQPAAPQLERSLTVPFNFDEPMPNNDDEQQKEEAELDKMGKTSSAETESGTIQQLGKAVMSVNIAAADDVPSPSSAAAVTAPALLPVTDLQQQQLSPPSSSGVSSTSSAGSDTLPTAAAPGTSSSNFPSRGGTARRPNAGKKRCYSPSQDEPLHVKRR